MNHISKIKWLLAAWLLFKAVNVPHVRACSLLGPLESWMTAANGFNPPTEFGGPTLIGGPKAIGNGYRWQIADTVNTNYWLETSTNLSGPGPVDWQPLFVVPVNGSVSSHINWAPASAQRFYQLVPDPFPWDGGLTP